MGGTRITAPEPARDASRARAPAARTVSDEEIYAPLGERERDPVAAQFAPLYAQLAACAGRYARYDAHSRQAFALYYAVLVELEVAARTHVPVDLDGLRQRARQWSWHGEAMNWMHVASGGERTFWETGPFGGALVRGVDPAQLFRAAVRDTDAVDDRPALDRGGDGVNRYMESDGWVGTQAEVEDRRFGAAVDAMDDVKSLGGAVAYGVSGLWTDDPQKRIQWAGLGNTAGNVLGTAAMPFGARLGPGEAPPAREPAALMAHPEPAEPEPVHERVVDAWQTSAQRGLPANAESIRSETVEMEQHPDYRAQLTAATAKGFRVVLVPGAPYVKVLERCDANGNVLEIVREMAIWPRMRYLDLQHELGHVRQLFERLIGVPTHREVLNRAGQYVPAKGNAAQGVLKAEQNAVAEYHNRLSELVRLLPIAPPHVLADELVGVDLWRIEAESHGMGYAGSLDAWAMKYFPEISVLEETLRSAGFALRHSGRAGRR